VPLVLPAALTHVLHCAAEPPGEPLLPTPLQLDARDVRPVFPPPRPSRSHRALELDMYFGERTPRIQQPDPTHLVFDPAADAGPVVHTADLPHLDVLIYAVDPPTRPKQRGRRPVEAPPPPFAPKAQLRIDLDPSERFHDTTIDLRPHVDELDTAFVVELRADDHPRPVSVFAQAADAVVMGHPSRTHPTPVRAVRLADGAPVAGVDLVDVDGRVTTDDDGLAIVPASRDAVHVGHPSYRVAWVGGASWWAPQPEHDRPAEPVVTVGGIEAPARVGPAETVTAVLRQRPGVDRADHASLDVHAWPTRWSVAGLDDHAFGAWDPDLLRWPTPEGIRWTLKQPLDADGVGHFRFQGSNSSMVHRLTLSAHDPLHPRIPWTTAEVLWLPGDRMVGLRLDQPSPGELVGSVVTVTADGELAPYAVVDLHLHHLSAFDHPVGDPRPAGVACRIRTDGRARGRCTLIAPHGGAYQVTATVRDDAGRASQTVTRVLVDGPDTSPGRWIDPHHVLITPRDVRCPRPPDGDDAAITFQPRERVGRNGFLVQRDHSVWERRPRGCLAPGDDVELKLRTDLDDATLWVTVTHDAGPWSQQLVAVVDGTATLPLSLTDADVGRMSVRAVAWGHSPVHDRHGQVLDLPPVLTDAYGQLDLWVQPPVLDVALVPTAAGVQARVTRDGRPVVAEVEAWFAHTGADEVLPPPWSLDAAPHGWTNAWWSNGRPPTARPTLRTGPPLSGADHHVYAPSLVRWSSWNGGRAPGPMPFEAGPRAHPPTTLGPVQTAEDGTLDLPWPSVGRQTVYLLARTDDARGWGHVVVPR